MSDYFPRVIIVSRRLERKNKLINWVSEIYLELLAKAGIVPIIVPVAPETPLVLEAYLQNYQGLLMVEGGDLGPHHYNENYPQSQLDEYDALKDEIELACFKHAYALNKPIMGFCRGMHIINAMLGGTNHLDIHEHNQKAVVHMDYDNYDVHRHPIAIMEGTPLHNWYQTHQLNVNSYHHQGIKNLAPGLKPMALAPDNLIEGVYNPTYPFMVGLQFHPERMYSEHLGNKNVFEAFFKAVNQNKTIIC
jgi:gamma-glutamyl-gamma-aminobutyrate hydrolase PuuD